MTSTHNNTTPPQPGRPWQYSLKTLLLVTLATAVALGILVSTPSGIAVPVMICLTIAIPALLTVVVVYGSGYQRTFCIGALFPTCTALYVTGWFLGLVQLELTDNSPRIVDDWLELCEGMGSVYRVYTANAWLLAILIGAAAVGVRRQLESRARREEHET